MGYFQGPDRFQGQGLQFHNLVKVCDHHKLQKLLWAAVFDITRGEIFSSWLVQEVDHVAESLRKGLLHLNHLPCLLHGAKEHCLEDRADISQEDLVGSMFEHSLEDRADISQEDLVSLLINEYNHCAVD